MKTIYANQVNLAGLCSNTPICCHWNKHGYWFNADVPYKVEELGEATSGAIVTFAALSKEEVQIWMNGVSAVLKLLQPETVEHPR